VQSPPKKLPYVPTEAEIRSYYTTGAVRRRVGHTSTETTQLYALLSDEVADAEIRAARRRRDRRAR
jgi:hypothetical protein